MRYIQNSLKVDSPQMTKIQECAAANNISVVLGFSENIHYSLYISQAIIGPDGKILTLRKKIKATHMERTIFGDSLGDCLHSVVDTPVARVGALSCWEHIQPLLKYHTYSQREQIHVAAWPPVFHDDGTALYSMTKEGTFFHRILFGVAFGKDVECANVPWPGTETLSKTYAMESQSFVLCTTAVITEPGIDAMGTQTGAVMNTPGGGFSTVYGPDGRQLTDLIPSTEEGIVYADLDLNEIYKSRAFVDLCGHYSRPDLLWLGVNSGVKTHVRDQGTGTRQPSITDAELNSDTNSSD